ncbi:unnamed protein product [Symbiodinium sp. CCMP2592]|nr:unnamed protein product [Symbiodinium sp. CCMP2592]
MEDGADAKKIDVIESAGMKDDGDSDQKKGIAGASNQDGGSNQKNDTAGAMASTQDGGSNQKNDTAGAMASTQNGGSDQKNDTAGAMASTQDGGSKQKNDTAGAGASTQDGGSEQKDDTAGAMASTQAPIATEQKAQQKPPGKPKEDLTPSFDRAVKMYAAEHNMAIDQVTLQMVKSSELGLRHYACTGLDTSARGAASQALHRALDKEPHVKHDVYKWLSEDLKKKFRTSWAIERSFEKVVRQRKINYSDSEANLGTLTVNRQQELGSWKSELQLRVHFGGAHEPEAKRQTDNYVAMCRQFGEIFCEFNKWTRAENFLLVERLSSSTQEEEWEEVASQMDSSPTYETEAYQSRARRKYAAAKGVPFETVMLKQVEESDLGLKGYAEMIITVPGIEVVEDDKDAKATNRKPHKRKAPKDFEEAPDEDAKTTEKDKKGKTEKDNNKKEPGKPKAKAKAKQEGSVKEAETAARTVVLQIQRASQTVERLQAALHGEQWAAPLMKEFDSLQAALKMQVTPTDGDDLGEFVSELKLAVFSGTGASSTKTLKKDYKDRYLPLLTMFKDRCQGAAQQ